MSGCNQQIPASTDIRGQADGHRGSLQSHRKGPAAPLGWLWGLSIPNLLI